MPWCCLAAYKGLECPKIGCAGRALGGFPVPMPGYDKAHGWLLGSKTNNSGSFRCSERPEAGATGVLGPPFLTLATLVRTRNWVAGAPALIDGEQLSVTKVKGTTATLAERSTCTSVYLLGAWRAKEASWR